MDDGNDGSSSAAQRAQDEDTSNERGTFLSRIIGVLSPHDTDAMVAVSNASGGGYAASFPVPGMVNLRRMRVEDVMVPKAEIVAVPAEISKDDLVAVFRDSGLSRLPVFDGTLDVPIGLIHLKDVALSHGFNGRGAQYDLKALLRPLLFAPPSMPIGVLLQKMQTDRTHMALVIDEYGGVDGLVTIEDLIEQVIGEIEDEHDLAEGTLWVKEQPGCFLAEARTPLEDFETEAGVHLRGIDEDDEEVDTLGGLVFLIAGRVPARGEVIGHPSGPEFEIVDADPRRIKRLRVRLKPSRKDA